MGAWWPGAAGGGTGAWTRSPLRRVGHDWSAPGRPVPTPGVLARVECIRVDGMAASSFSGYLLSPRSNSGLRREFPDAKAPYRSIGRRLPACVRGQEKRESLLRAWHRQDTMGMSVCPALIVAPPRLQRRSPIGAGARGCGYCRGGDSPGYGINGGCRARPGYSPTGLWWYALDRLARQDANASNGHTPAPWLSRETLGARTGRLNDCGACVPGGLRGVRRSRFFDRTQ